MDELKSMVEQMGINISEQIRYIKDNWRIHSNYIQI